MSETKITDNTSPSPDVQAGTKAETKDVLHRYQDAVSGEIKILPASFMTAHRAMGCTKFCLSAARPETGSQSQS